MKIIIPAYQPDHKLLKLVQSLLINENYDIVIINDGSSPQCDFIFQEVQALGCTILKHTQNQGKGAALKTAFSYILGKEREGFICADCDGQHTWKDIKKIADAIPHHRSCIILGCRGFVGSVPFRNLIGNKITRSIITSLSGRKVEDTQTGLRGFSADMLPWLIKVKGTRFEYEMNQLLDAKSVGYELCSVPIETIYNGKNQVSHFHPILDSFRIYFPILKYSMSSITCATIDFIALLLFQSITHNLLASVVIARVISSICNYILNKYIVFESSNHSHLVAIAKFYTLVTGVLICNYFLLLFLTQFAGFSLIMGKILTECLLFLVSYFVQQKLIFSRK